MSHWEVASDATVKLIIKAVAELKIGRAEALHRSMLSLIPTGKDTEAHPTFCAPFVLVGEGGAASNSLDHWSVLLASSDQRANLVQTNVDTDVRAAAPEGRIAAE